MIAAEGWHRLLIIADRMKRISLLVLTICWSAGCGQTTSSSSTGFGGRITDRNGTFAVMNEQHPKEEHMANPVLKEIEDMPIWSSTPFGGDRKRFEPIEQSLVRIADYDSDTIRRAFVYSSQSLLNQRTVALEEKLFLINHYIFALPTVDDGVMRYFGGWVPDDPRIEGPLWPFVREQPTGDIRLRGYFAGYLGPRYAPLEEFDFFLRQYGRRRLAPRKQND